MKAKATFNIDGSVKITGHGLVIYGDIIEGLINPYNLITFDTGTNKMTLKIKGIDFLDNIKDNVSKIALTFHYENDNERDNLQTLRVTRQIATIAEE